MIVAENIGFGVGGRMILNPVSIEFKRSELVVILGPNGAGKSTLIQLLAGYLDPTVGNVSYHQQDLKSWKTNSLAKNRAYLHQQSNVFGSFTVQEIVEMGRFPHDESHEELQRITVDTLVELKLFPKRNQSYQTLSGGEQQRVQFARAIIQLETENRTAKPEKVLFLDEPLNNLDLHYQYSLMEQAQQKIIKQGGIVIAVLHDINMAYAFADRIIIVKNGHVVVDNTTELALEPEILESIFDIGIQKNQVGNEIFFSMCPRKSENKHVQRNKQFSNQ